MTHEHHDPSLQPETGPPPGPDAGPDHDETSPQAGSRQRIFASGIQLAPEDHAAVALRRDGVRAQYPPENGYQVLLTSIAGHAVYGLERCDAWASHLSLRQSRAAQLDWNFLRTDQARERLAKLHRCPERVASQLEQTPQGCTLAIELWQHLGQVLRIKGRWNDPQRSMALDLLGVPRALREEGVTVLDAQAGEETPAVSRLQDIVGCHVERLQARADSPLLQENDAQERQEVINRCHPWECDESRQLQRLRRQYARDFQWSISQLKQCQAPRRRLEREIDTRGDQAERTLERNAGFLRQAAEMGAAAAPAPKPEPPKPAQVPPRPAPNFDDLLREPLPQIPFRATPPPSGKPLTKKEKRDLQRQKQAMARANHAGPQPRT